MHNDADKGEKEDSSSCTTMADYELELLIASSSFFSMNVLDQHVNLGDSNQGASSSRAGIRVSVLNPL